MGDDEVSAGGVVGGGNAVVVRIALLVALLLGGLVTFMVTPFAVMASDACPPGGSAGICSATRQELVVRVPTIGVPLVVLAAALGLAHRRLGPLFGLAGLGGLAAVWITVLALVGG